MLSNIATSLASSSVVPDSELLVLLHAVELSNGQYFFTEGGFRLEISLMFAGSTKLRVSEIVRLACAWKQSEQMRIHHQEATVGKVSSLENVRSGMAFTLTFLAESRPPSFYTGQS